MTTTYKASGFLSPVQPAYTELEQPDLIVELLKTLKTIFRRVHARTYYEQAPENVKYPYVVYTLSNGVDQGDMQLFMLDVDVWDAPEYGDTTQLEILAGLVDRSLHKRVANTDAGFSFVIYRDRRFPVEDPDKRIRRRKAIYQLRLFKRGSDYHGE